MKREAATARPVVGRRLICTLDEPLISDEKISDAAIATRA